MEEEKYINYEGLTRYDLLLKSKIGVEADAGHEYVEIAGIKWATMNIGANSVTDTGLYFQWGDTQGYTAAQCGSGEGQKYFGWADYKYSNDNGSVMTKYNYTDYKMLLDASDDAVTAAWGNQWRMPTTNEYVALGNAVNTEWIANYQDTGVAGLVCTDKEDSSKVLFFPAAGRCSYGSVYDVDNLYWSNSVNGSIDILTIYSLSFSNSHVVWLNYIMRYNGFPVRGIYIGPDKVLGTTILDSERIKWNNAANNCITSTTSGLKIEVVLALPTITDPNTIYIVL